MLSTCALCFLILARWTDERVCYTLSAVAALLFINALVFSNTGFWLYFNRGLIAFCAAMYLLKRINLQSIFQSLILFVTLISYTLLQLDVINNTSIIYDQYGAVIYGLIACHFIGVLAKLWPIGTIVSKSFRVGVRNL